MRKCLFVPIVVVMLVGLILGACAPAQSPAPTTPTPAPATAKVIELNVALGSPPQHTNTVTYTNWANDVEKATNGRVKFKIFSSGSLLKEAEIADGILKGIADVGHFQPAVTPNRFPTLQCFEIPGIGPSSAMSSTFALNEARNTLKLKEYDQFKMLWSASPGSAHIGMLKKPVRTLEDLKGVEIRGAGMTKDALDALGAVGVAIPMPETPLALQKGIVAGAAHSPETLLTEHFADYFKSVTVCYIYSAFVFNYAFNLQKWNSLPADIQKTIEEVSAGYPKKYGELCDSNNAKGWALLKEKNIEIIRLPDSEYARWLKAWEPMKAKWIADMNAKGAEGQKIYDMAAQLMEKYYKQYPDVSHQ
jgi:TRAP-type transport system periplasmic protein